MKLLRVIFLISIFVVVYLIGYKIYAKNQAVKLKGKVKKKTINIFLTKFRKILPDIENYATYLIAKTALFITFFYLGITNYQSLFMGLIFSILGFLLPDFMIKIMKNAEKKHVLIDLLNVVESLKIQMSSNIPLIVALKNIPSVCKNKKFKNSLIDMQLEYELSGYSLIASCKTMRKKFKYVEVNMFLSAIEQQVKYGKASETYENLITILKEKYIEYIESNTQTKMLFMTLGIVIVLINLAVMGCYPIIVEVNQNLTTMLG